jgi:hypothetical protein
MPIPLRAQPSDELLPSNDFPASDQDPAPSPALKVISEPPAAVSLLAQPELAAVTGDPLQAIRAMSEEEKIALFS